MKKLLSNLIETINKEKKAIYRLNKVMDLLK